MLETHLHADFVSGHRDLADRTGATIAIGAKAEAGFRTERSASGDTIAVGGVRIRAIETPGHTPESLSFLVYERAGDETPWAVLTGDTLFVGDVGRVDILSSRLPVTDLAGHDVRQPPRQAAAPARRHPRLSRARRRLPVRPRHLERDPGAPSVASA